MPKPYFRYPLISDIPYLFQIGTTSCGCPASLRCALTPLDVLARSNTHHLIQMCSVWFRYKLPLWDRQELIRTQTTSLRCTSSHSDANHTLIHSTALRCAPSDTDTNHSFNALDRFAIRILSLRYEPHLDTLDRYVMRTYPLRFACLSTQNSLIPF